MLTVSPRLFSLASAGERPQLTVHWRLLVLPLDESTKPGRNVPPSSASMYRTFDGWLYAKKHACRLSRPLLIRMLATPRSCHPRASLKVKAKVVSPLPEAGFEDTGAALNTVAWTIPAGIEEGDSAAVNGVPTPT